jgi:hypothetical protein
MRTFYASVLLSLGSKAKLKARTWAGLRSGPRHVVGFPPAAAGDLELPLLKVGAVDFDGLEVERPLPRLGAAVAICVISAACGIFVSVWRLASGRAQEGTLPPKPAGPGVV